jgi:hypothetical protein
LLLTCHREGALEVLLGVRHTMLRRLQGDFTGNAIDFRLIPSFAVRFDCRGRLVTAAPSVIELTEVGVGAAGRTTCYGADASSFSRGARIVAGSVSASSR